MIRSLRAGIIGAGRIGWRYDGGRWNGKSSLSHASCLDRHPETHLVAMADNNIEVRSEIAEAMGNGVFVTNDLNAFFDLGLDIVCIASPTELHASQIRACVAAGIKYILVEKPVTRTLAEHKALTGFLKTASAVPRICVNYFRRSLPQVVMFREECLKGELKALDIVYSRGLAVNGVHLVDLVGFVFESAPVCPPTWITGSTESPSFGFNINGVDIIVRGMDLPYHCIEMRATLNDRRVSLLAGGARLTKEDREENLDYPGFYRLGSAVDMIDPVVAQDAMQEGTYRSLCDLLDDSMPLQSTVETAGFAQELLEQVEAQWRAR